MRLRTLGTLELEGAEFTRPKPLLLLAYLALEGPQERRFVASLFWPGRRDAMNSLTVALSRLRQGASGAVQADGRRVWTDVTSDAAQFLSLLEHRQIEEALGAYHGPFLAGVHPRHVGVELEEWIWRTREYLAGLAQDAMLDSAEREAARRRFTAAARSAEKAFELASTAPEPETLARLHTLLLAGESLKTARVRREAEEFGLSLVDSVDAARARVQASIGGGGPGTSHNLDALGGRDTGYVGRDLDMTEVATQLSRPECRVLTLVGVAGVGKTRLARQVAQEQLTLGAFPGGVIGVPLEYVRSPEAVPATIAAALDVDVHRTQDVHRSLASRLGEAPALLVLDNFEHLMDAAVEVSSLVRACPELTVLVTSRERLNLEGEHIYRVTGLPFPADDDVGEDEAYGFDAVRLFVRRAQRARPDYEFTADEVPHVIRICRLVEGLPLGLELAAVWAKAMTSREIAEELERDLDLLITPSRDVAERHQSLRAAFEHSWRLLAHDEQQVLRELACFQGGFRRRAAGEVAGATIPILASLVDKSLLRVDATGRFDRHPLLYQYTEGKLQEGGDRAHEVCERHAAYHVRLLDAYGAEVHAGEQGEMLDVIDEELENLRAAWHWTIDQRRFDRVRRMIDPLAWFFKIRGRWQEGIDFLDAAVGRTGDDEAVDRSVLGSVYTAQARLLQELGRYEEAARLAHRGLASLQPDRDAQGTLRGLDTLARVAWRSGRSAEAKVYWDKALDVAQAHDDPQSTVVFLGDVAMIEQELGDYVSAERTYGEALERSREGGNQLHVIRNLNNLGELCLLTDRPAKARDLVVDSIARAERISFHGILPYLTLNLGLIAFEQGDLQEAEAKHHEALRQAGDTGDPSLRARALAGLSRLSVASGALGRAAAYAEEAMRLSWEIRDMPDVLASVVSLAELRAQQGRPADAAGLLSLVLRHPATSQIDRRRTHRLLHDVRNELTPKALVDAMERGRERGLADVVTSALQAPSAGP
ncbi:MAG: tetratricopeptide repeat protein [Trueperaceae bacterium]|nr:tetratricopeptide repeat protein [Trueperaceae bacterium]